MKGDRNGYVDLGLFFVLPHFIFPFISKSDIILKYDLKKEIIDYSCELLSHALLKHGLFLKPKHWVQIQMLFVTYIVQYEMKLTARMSNRAQGL